MRSTIDASEPVDQPQSITEILFVNALLEVMSWPYSPSVNVEVDQVILSSLAFWQQPLPKCYACKYFSIGLIEEAPTNTEHVGLHMWT